MKILSVADYLLTGSFFILFFFVPLIWLPSNYELFEFNKMILVYFLTVVVVTAWLVKAVSQKKLIIQRTPLDFAIVLFLTANILATIFSLDPVTSIFGYYGRFHGGLLSTFCYLILFYALVSNFTKEHIFYFLYTLLFSSFLVSFYGVLQHPNPFFATYGPKDLNFIETLRQVIKNPLHVREFFSQITFHGIDYNYWAVDVENRSFSTLGQANWLAAFNAMLFFPLLCFLFLVKKTWQKTLIFFFLATNYLAFTFAYSRAGLLGLAAGSATFLVLLPLYRKGFFEKIVSSLNSSKILFLYQRFKNSFFWLLAIVILVVVVNFFFGNAFQRRGGIQTKIPSTTTTQDSGPKQTALETGGVQTATIRTIVWSGSWRIFLHYPIFGTGVETFGFSYYLFRPAAHNLTVEWDYLYNKAHNEYLNFLSTTGAVGFLSYLFLIGLFEFLAVRFVVKTKWSVEKLLSIGLLAGFNSYLVQNFFGFSVVPIGLLFFLFPAFFLMISLTLPKKEVNLDLTRLLPFLKQKSLQIVMVVLVFLVGIIFMLNVVFMWLADYYYNQSLSGATYASSITSVRTAVRLASYQPLYSSELAVELAGYASTLTDKDKQTLLALEAKKIIDNCVKTSPHNFSLWQDSKNVYFYLTEIDKGYSLDLQNSAETLGKLAPTDAKTQYNLALVYSFLEKTDLAEKQLEKALSLKSDYSEAVLSLARTYQVNKKDTKGVELLKKWLKVKPDDSEANNLLKQILTGQ